MIGGWGLPINAEIGGKVYPINSDFRDVLEVVEWLNKPDDDEMTRLYVALSLFYEQFESMPQSCYDEAVKWMMDFIALGEEDDVKRRPKLFDWEQDRNVIVSEINKVAGQEVRSLDFLHWWTFVGYFNCIGEGQFSMIVSVRDKIQRGKTLERYEREFYNRNRIRVDFKRKYTQEEDELLDKWMK